jgi:hypothetical protein
MNLLYFCCIGLSEDNDGRKYFYYTLAFIIKFNLFYLNNFSLGLMR